MPLSRSIFLARLYWRRSAAGRKLRGGMYTGGGPSRPKWLSAPGFGAPNFGPFALWLRGKSRHLSPAFSGILTQIKALSRRMIEAPDVSRQAVVSIQAREAPMVSWVHSGGVLILGLVLLALTGLQTPARAELVHRMDEPAGPNITVHRMGEPAGPDIRVHRMGEPAGPDIRVHRMGEPAGQNIEVHRMGEPAGPDIKVHRIGELDG